MQAGPEVTRGGTDAIGAGNLVYPMGLLGLTFKLLSICIWHPEQTFTHGLPAHTLTHTDRGVRVPHVCLSDSVLPTLQSCLLSLWQQDCSMSSALRTFLVPKPLHASKTLHLSVLPLYSFVTFPEQSQSTQHVLTFKKPTVHRLEF